MLNKKNKQLIIVLLTLLAIILISLIPIITREFNSKYYIEFDPYYYHGLTENFLKTGNVFLLDAVSLYPDKSTLSLPLFPLLVGVIKLIVPVDLFILYKSVNIFLLVLISIMIYVVARKITQKIGLSLLASLIYLHLPYIISRSLQPLRENVSLLLMILFIYFTITHYKNELSLKKYLVLFILIFSTGLFYYTISAFLTAIIFLFYLVFFAKVNKKYKSYTLIFLLISLALSLISQGVRHWIYSTLIYYLFKTQGLQWINYSIFSSNITPIIILLLSLSTLAILFNKSEESNAAKLVLGILLIWMTILFLNNFLTNRAYLYIGGTLAIISPLFLKRYSKLITIFFVFTLLTILIVTPVTYFDKVWINDSEIAPLEWANLNIPSDAVIITQKGMGYLTLPFAKRSVMSASISFPKENSTQKNFIDSITYLSNGLNKRGYRDVYVYIANKTNVPGYEDNFWIYVNRDWLKDSGSFQEIYSNNEAMIYRYK